MVSIFAGVRGYLDGVAVRDITRFERQFLADMRANHADILKAIRDEQKISDEVEAKLKGVLDKFTRAFG